MNRKRFVIIVFCLFVVCATSTYAIDIRTSSLNLAKKVSPTNSDIKEFFATQFNILTFALNMYQLDTDKRFTKDIIKEKLFRSHALWQEEFNIKFDLDNIDFKKKGFTRYYPFSVDEKRFIIRLFNIEEKKHLSDMQIFYEGVLEDSNLGFQIVPGLVEILNSTKAEKVEIQDPSVYSTHP